MTDRLYRIIFIDSCAFYPPQKNEKSAMDELWKLEDEGALQLRPAEATYEEMQRAPHKLRNRINSRITSFDRIGIQEEKTMLTAIEKLLFSNKSILKDNEKRDVRNLFCAKKYGCHMFVTVDKEHILSKAHMIRQRLGMEVVSPTQCFSRVLERLRVIRDYNEAMNKKRLIVV